ncbi:response regulator [Ancylobacter terrae]|uniref:response regulator n=1 Tax=Ancylobacter sp. sgz301288 TaxID=3342077 RepID=UPI003859916A
MSFDARQPLNGCRIFILEDEPLVAMMVEAMIEELGAEAVSTASRVDEALAFIAAETVRIDAALIDVNVGGQRSYDVAHALAARAIPFVFASGYDDASFPEEWRQLPRLGKPFQLNELEAALLQAIGTGTRGREVG